MRLISVILLLAFTLSGHAETPALLDAKPESDPDKALILRLEKAEAKSQEFHLTEDDNARLMVKLRTAAAAINLASLQELSAKADKVAEDMEKDGVTEDIVFRSTVIGQVLTANQVRFNLHVPLEPDDQKAMDKLTAFKQLVQDKLKSTTD